MRRENSRVVAMPRIEVVRTRNRLRDCSLWRIDMGECAFIQVPSSESETGGK